jgi:hypothetical protein
MTISIIVARYNENVEWTKQFPNVYIYNKGTPLGDGYNEILLDNVGREGHTYYKYICNNYENLEDYIIFLQGNPFDHSPNIISNLKKCVYNKNLNIEFEFLSEYIHNSSFHLESKNPECKNIYNTWKRVFGKNNYNNEYLYNMINWDRECIFGAGAQFIVSKNTILKNSKDFYKNIVTILEYSMNPIEGYDIERFHKYIFS